MENTKSETIGQKPTKHCGGCRRDLPRSEFYRNSKTSDGLQTRCKGCAREAQRANYGARNITQRQKRKQNWDKIFEYFGGRKCIHCGIESKWPIYDLHHKDPNTKDVSIGTIAHYNWDKVFPEVEKCVLLCANCHRIAHAKERKETLDPI